jgi:tetratricopeptide (TPR) repeat protein
VRIQCNRAAGTVAYTLQDDQFVEHAFARMVELVRLGAAAPTATPTQPMASASESMEAAVLAASSAVPVPAHPLAAAEEIASGLCSFYPALPAAHYNYAIILVKRNNLPQALTELEAAVDLGISPAVAHSDADLALLHREVRFRLLGAAPADRTPEVKTLLELFGDLSAADARAALARYGSVHRAADALLASDGVLSPEPAAPQAVGLGPYQGPLHGQHRVPPPPPPRPNGPGFYSLSGFPGFGNRR